MKTQLNSLLEKLSAITHQVKALLTRNYSIQDLRNLLNTIKAWLISVSEEPVQNTSLLVSMKSLNLKQIIRSLQGLIIRHRKAFLILAPIFLVWIFYTAVLSPFSMRLQEQLEMRPAQWSQLQSLIRITKSNNSGPSVTVSQLDEQELQKISNSLAARGIKPSVLRLSTDNPPVLEFQASNVMFSVWLDALEELRATWRLYPTQITVIASGGAGTVSVSGVLTQYGTSANQVGAAQ